MRLHSLCSREARVRRIFTHSKRYHMLKPATFNIIVTKRCADIGTARTLDRRAWPLRRQRGRDILGANIEVQTQNIAASAAQVKGVV